VDKASKKVSSAAKTAAKAKVKGKDSAAVKVAKVEAVALKQKAKMVTSQTQAKKVVAKMFAIKKTVQAADAAKKKAAVKAKAVQKAAAALDKQAVKATKAKDTVKVGQAAVLMLQGTVKELAGKLARRKALKLSSASAAKIASDVVSLNAKVKAQESDIAALIKARKTVAASKDHQKVLAAAVALRKDMERKQKDVKKEKQAKAHQKKLMELQNKINVQVAKKRAEKWKKAQIRKLGGPSMPELLKQRAKIDASIKLLKQKALEAKTAGERLKMANLSYQKLKTKLRNAQADTKESQHKLSKLPRTKKGKFVSRKKGALMRTIDSREKREKRIRKHYNRKERAYKAAKGTLPNIKNAAKTEEAAKAAVKKAEMEKTKLAAALAKRMAFLKRKKLGPLVKEQGQKDLIKAKEALEKSALKLKGARKARNKATELKIAVTKAEKKAKAKVKQEKVDKVNRKNKWVRNMVVYAEKEKALKKTGEGTSKHKAKKASERTKKAKIKAAGEVKLAKQRAKVQREKDRKAAKRSIEKSVKKGTAAAVAAAESKNKGIERTKKIKARAAAKVKAAKEKAKKLANIQELKEKKATALAQCIKSRRIDKIEHVGMAKSKESAKKFNVKYTLSLKEQHKVSVKAKTALAGNIKNAKGNAKLIAKAKAEYLNQKKLIGIQERATKKNEQLTKKDLAMHKESEAKATKAYADSCGKEEKVVKAREKHTKAVKRRKEMARKAMERAGKKKKADVEKKAKAAAKKEKAQKALIRAKEQEAKALKKREKAAKQRKRDMRRQEKAAKRRVARIKARALKDLSIARGRLDRDVARRDGAKTRKARAGAVARVKTDKRVLRAKRKVADKYRNAGEREKAKKADMAALMRQVKRAREKARKNVIATKKAAEKAKKKAIVDAKKMKALKAKREKNFKRVQRATAIAEKKKKSLAKASSEKEFKRRKASEVKSKKILAEKKTKVAAQNEKAKKKIQAVERKTKEVGMKEKGFKVAREKAKKAAARAKEEKRKETAKKVKARRVAAEKRAKWRKERAVKKKRERKAKAELGVKRVAQARNESTYKRRKAAENRKKKAVKRAQEKQAKLNKRRREEKNRKHRAKVVERNNKKMKKAERKMKLKMAERMGKFKLDQAKKRRAAAKLRKAAAKRSTAKELARKKGVAAAHRRSMAAAVAKIQNMRRRRGTTVKVSGWVKCASEGGTCNIRGKALIRYGVNGEYVSKIGSGKVRCSGVFFGSLKKRKSSRRRSSRRRRRAAMLGEGVDATRGRYCEYKMVYSSSRRRRTKWVGKHPFDVRPAKKKSKPRKPTSNGGWSASFWKNVKGVTSVAGGIKKIAKRKPDLVQRVYNIQYKKTGGHFRGLNTQYRTHFVARFKGHVKIAQGGDYTFWTSSNDGSQLFIAGKRVVNNDGVHKMRKRKGKIRLTAGLKVVVVDFFQGNGLAGLKVDWAGPGFGRKPLDGSTVEMKPKAPAEMDMGEARRGGSSLKDDVKTMEAKVVQAVDSAVDGESALDMARTLA